MVPRSRLLAALLLPCLAAASCTPNPATAEIDVPEAEAPTGSASKEPDAPPASGAPALPPIDGEQAITRYIDGGDRCPWASSARKAVACLHVDLEMGFADIGLGLHDAEGGVSKYAFYSGNVAFEAKGYQAEVLADANRQLAAFDEEGIEAGKGSITLSQLKVTMNVNGRTYNGQLRALEQQGAPPSLKGKVEDCEHFEVESGTVFPKTGLAIAKIAVVRAYTNTDKSHGCYITEEVNDETFPQVVRTVVLKAL